LRKGYFTAEPQRALSSAEVLIISKRKMLGCKVFLRIKKKDVLIVEFFFRQSFEPFRFTTDDWLAPDAVRPVAVSDSLVVGCPANTEPEIRQTRNVEKLEGHTALGWDDWVAAACAGVPSTLVHGDFRPKNAYLRDDGAGMCLFPIDWEMAGWGVPAADLTRVDLRAYWAVVRERWPDVDLGTVERLALFGQIFRLLAGIGWAATNFALVSGVHQFRILPEPSNSRP